MVFWLTATGAASYGGIRLMGSDASEDEAKRAVTAVTRFVTRQERSFDQVDPTSQLQPGDPVFLPDDEGQFRQVGRVAERSESTDGTQTDGTQVSIIWYESSISADECQLLQYHSTGRLSEVVETLLPPERQKRIREKIATAMTQHGEDLSRAFVPLVEQSLKESLPVIEAQFRVAVADHRDEIDEAARRWNDELVQKRLIPLARREILPIVKKHGQPPAEEIGREIWDRASLFRFGWRAVYDKSPLPRKDLVREEWQRFVEDEAVPVMEKHMDEIVVAIQRSLRDVTSNAAIRKELAGVAEDIASDSQSRELIQEILKETFVDNPALRDVWRDVWTSDEAKQAFEVAGYRLEPVVREIGDEIFGSEQDGINPDFARVLRTQILRKDRRWIVAWHTGVNTGTIEVAKRTMPYPVVYLARED